MKRKLIGEMLFWGVGALALALYFLSMPEGIPWQQVTENRYWQYFVEMTNGNAVILTSVSAAIAGGLVAALFNRYLGWRVGLAFAILWVFMPGVWNRAILGERGIFFASVVVGGLWALNLVALWVTRKARSTKPAEPAATVVTTGARLNRIASWAFLGVVCLFAIVSASMHDYQLGEAASAYARQIVDEAGERVILMNGVCDEQLERLTLNRISFRRVDEDRSNLVAWVKREWPSETNLWLGAEISPTTFAEVAVKAHPDRFYTMNGQSTSLPQWEARWEGMKPYLDSDDPFVPVMRRSFAYEGNYLGNVLQEKGELDAAWNLYMRIFNDIHPKNPAACVNLNEMLRRGYKVDDLTRQRVESAQADYAKIMKDRRKALRMAQYISHFGPVMRDQKAYDEFRERIRKHMEELEKKGEQVANIPDLKTLEEWHPEMMKAFQSRDFDKATRIARAILSRRAWHGFIPAHMVMGEAMMMKQDWVSAEAFLRVAINGKGEAAPPPLVLNDYAETLRQLHRCAEAEPYARRAVEKTDAKNGWIYRLTLAQVLRDGKLGKEDEIKLLIKQVLDNGPKEVRQLVRKEFPR